MPIRMPIAPNRGDAAPAREQSLLYKAVMTPVIFVSFLVSLAIVDFRYAIMRSHYHPEEYTTRLPRWLHRLIYRYQPYQYVRVGKDGNPLGPHAGHDFYHSNQKKLMKMEIDDAFELRKRVLFMVGVLGVLASWALCRVATWFLSAFGLW